MNPLSIIFASLISLSVSAQSNFTINGKVDQLKDGNKVFLIYQVEEQLITDSSTVTNGEFFFKGNLEFPVFSNLYLHINPYRYKPERGETIDYFRFYLAPEQMNMTAADSLKHIVIKGSDANKVYAELRSMLAGNDEKFVSLRKEFDSLPQEKQKDKTIFQGFLDREKQLMQESFQIHLNFAEKHSGSYLSVISLSYVAAQPGMNEAAGKLYQQLPEKFRNSPAGKGIPVLLASQLNTQIGKDAIDFSQQSPDGIELAVSDFRTQYLLLDFWASWCGPCREENPNLVAAYQKYHAKGFEILGISLDSRAQKDAWIQAIEKDGLSWPQVSDLKGWENAAAKLYGVRGIPANFLIDPDGKIIARDLRGKELEDKLESIFKDR